MTQPTQHPSEELILDYARGALEAGRALVVAAHLGACPACRATVRLAEAVGGALIEELEPAPLAPDALARTLARLDAPQPPPAAVQRPPDNWIRVPPEVIAAATRHKRWAAPGVWVADVTGGAKAWPRSYLLGVGAGMAVPRHTHRGREFVCVLKGAFEDRGVVYGPGDFAESDEGVEHRPRVSRDGECVCLTAADHALAPRELIGRLFQPLVRI
ncbi:MAG TPA: ChrR family anti-sigma-E factor [Caulobacteraceae bacterium]|nr:ChrR family anti-sigma-E factor [Caulobacteraceae bacterium]